MGAKPADSFKAKKASSRTPSGSALTAPSVGQVTVQLYNRVIDKANSQGVKLAKRLPNETNPYLLPPREAVKVAKKAGIITRKGNLSPRFK